MGESEKFGHTRCCHGAAAGVAERLLFFPSFFNDKNAVRSSHAR